MKRFYTLILTLGMLTALMIPASGAVENRVNITVNGTPINSDLAYITESGTTMIPLRLVMEALGCNVDWDASTRTVSITASQPQPPAQPEPALPEKTPLVVIDPGHGGESNGAEYGGFKEKDLNLSIALQTASLLESEGIAVRMTRMTDEDVDLYARTDFANELKADLFVSVHCNASTEYPDAEGIYTCAYQADTPGWTLAAILHDSMIAATGAPHFDIEERPNLAVLRTSEMPAALVECGFMSTETDLARLVQPEYQANLARGIADGILAYLAQ